MEVGNFHTKGVVRATFQLTEVNPMAKIDYKLHIVDSLGVYNMILSKDVLSSLGLILDYFTKTITWDDASIPTKATSAEVSDSFHNKDPKGIDDM
eukprot:11255983-Ditylum_brightwellii.AAC.1